MTRSFRALKLGEALELFKSSVDLRARQCAEALYPKAFATKAAENRAINHRAMEDLAVHSGVAQIESTLGEVTDKPTGEAVARAGRIEHLLEQIPGHDEVG